MTEINQDFHLLEITLSKHIFQCYQAHNLPPKMESFFLAEPVFEIIPNEMEVGVPFLHSMDINNKHVNLPRRSPFVYEIPSGSVLGHSNIVVNNHNQFSVEGLIFNPLMDVLIFFKKLGTVSFKLVESLGSCPDIDSSNRAESSADLAKTPP